MSERELFESAESLNVERDLSDRVCLRPFNYVEIQEGGEMYLCCSAWLSKSAGTYEVGKTVSEIWNSDAAREVRESIRDGSFKYCRKKICPRIQDGTLPRRNELSPKWRAIIEGEEATPTFPEVALLAHDRSCNLSCPSCRTAKINHVVGSPLYDRSIAITNAILDELVLNPKLAVELNVSGAGDPFASAAFRHLLQSIDGSRHPNLRISIQTNGTMLTPTIWQSMRKIHANIVAICISIDAATPETYRVVRRGGDWDTLIENLKYLGGLGKKKQGPYLTANMVVQERNYREMAAFAEIFLDVGFKEINYTSIANWNTWDAKEYEKQCVWKLSHPDFDRFMEVLRAPILGDSRIRLGNLTEYRKRALAEGQALGGVRSPGSPGSRRTNESHSHETAGSPAS